MTVSTRLATRLAALAAATLAASALATTAAEATPAPAQTADLRLISFNDFHGNLTPPAGSSGRVTVPGGTTVDAGGAAFVATHVKELRGAVKNSLLLSTGDNIGASPLNSALFHDEPTIEFLNTIGVQASVIGNHEFDEGYRELLRMQFGGCNPTDGCQFRPTFKGANFPYLGANVTFNNGLPALLPFTVKVVEGVPVAIIGVTLKDLPSVVIPSAVEGFKFHDEVKTLNTTSKLLDLLGIKTQVVLMHQGDATEATATPDSCTNTSGPARTIATTASASIDVFFTGHSHTQYNCVVTDPAGKPRPLIQGLSFGRLLSVVDIKIDKKTKDVVRTATVAHNEIVTRTTADPAVQALVDEATTKSAPIANRQIGTITADLVRAAPESGESPLGDVIADAQLAGTSGNSAVIAMTNPGGIRTDLTYASSAAGEGNGVVTYGEAFAVQPFANIMQTITLTGAQIKTVLEQQWQTAGGAPVTRFLQISDSLHYSWSRSGTQGNRVSNITVAGAPIDPAASYRVSVNNFLAAGGDGFTELANGTNLAGGPIDLDALATYLTANPNVAPPAPTRVTVLP